MKIIVVRHDNKRLKQEERERQCKALTQFMASLNLQNVVVFSSKSDDAKLTSDTLCDLSSIGKIELRELTDKPPPSDLVERILDEAERNLGGKPAVDTWVLIGHHPRLSQFLARVTGTRQRPLGHLDAVCVSAANPTQFRLGLGHIDWRYPILDVEGDKLGPKLQSKMVVGTLLAGFNFTALLELLKDEKTLVIKGTSPLTSQVSDYVKFWEWNHEQLTIAFNSLSILCLSVALVLFIASVYIFDTLAMPEGFLAHEPQEPRTVRQKGRFHNKVIWLGFVYASMIHTWRWVFSPAVVLSGLAALLLVGRLRSGWLLVFWSVLIVLAGLYYFLWKPRRMVD
jgi:phosphohistidine phosphatase SixA